MICRRKIFIALFILYLLAVGYICFSSGESFPSFNESIFGEATDKVIHFTMFLPFVFLYYSAFVSAGNRKSLMPWAIAAGIGLTAMTELVQYFLPTRTAEILDVAADCAGVLVGAAFTLVITKMKRI